MDVELIEIRDFLAQHPPFDHLPLKALDPLVGEISIRYLRRNSTIPPEDAKGKYLYLVRKGAVAIFDENGKLQEKLGEGDYFIPSCDETGGIPLNGKTEEDTLVYLAPCDVLRKLRNTSEEFDAFFTAGATERLRRAISEITDDGPLTNNNLITVEVADLFDPRVVSVDSNNTVQEAACKMTECGVSSLLITEDGKLAGILTDKDLRRRFLCETLPYDTPVGEIMTPEPVTIDIDTLGFEALLRMTRMSVHHLPLIFFD